MLYRNIFSIRGTKLLRKRALGLSMCHEEAVPMETILCMIVMKLTTFVLSVFDRSFNEELNGCREIALK